MHVKSSLYVLTLGEVEGKGIHEATDETLNEGWLTLVRSITSDSDPTFRGTRIRGVVLDGFTEATLMERFPQLYMSMQNAMLTLGAQFYEIPRRSL